MTWSWKWLLLAFGIAAVAAGAWLWNNLSHRTLTAQGEAAKSFAASLTIVPTAKVLWLTDVNDRLFQQIQTELPRGLESALIKSRVRPEHPLQAQALEQLFSQVDLIVLDFPWRKPDTISETDAGVIQQAANQLLQGTSTTPYRKWSQAFLFTGRQVLVFEKVKTNEAK